MNGLNKAILIGEIADTPKLKTVGATPHLAFRIHTAESVPDEHGQLRERKSWHTVVVWGRRGEALAKILSRGMRLAIEGRIVNRSYDDATGKKYVTEIYANDVVILGSERQNAA